MLVLVQKNDRKKWYCILNYAGSRTYSTVIYKLIYTIIDVFSNDISKKTHT